MVSCPRNIKTVLNLESVKVYDKYISKTKEIILGYRAYQHTKTGFLNYLAPQWEILSGHVYIPELEQNAEMNLCNPEE